jgi:hypothetical protein
MQRPAFHVVVLAVWLLYMMAVPMRVQVQSLLHYRWHADNAAERGWLDAGVQAIHDRSRPTDSLFVWGYNPRLYWLTGRPSAIRYIGTEKAEQLGARGQPLLDTILAELKVARPKLVVVNPQDIHPRADAPDADRLDLRAFWDWLRPHYTQANQQEYRALWVRNE